MTRDLCCCEPGQCVTAIVRAQLLPIVCCFFQKQVSQWSVSFRSVSEIVSVVSEKIETVVCFFSFSFRDRVSGQ